MTDIVNIRHVANIIPAKRTTYSILAKLMEEAGELALEVAIDKGDSYKKPGSDGIVGEAVDLIICAVDMIHTANPDLSQKELEDVITVKLTKWIAASGGGG